MIEHPQDHGKQEPETVEDLAPREDESVANEAAHEQRNAGDKMRNSLLTLGAAALTAAALGLGVATASPALAFNPQPDPPGRPLPGLHVDFNPQPDPPGRIGIFSRGQGGGAGRIGIFSRGQGGGAGRS